MKSHGLSGQGYVARKTTGAKPSQRPSGMAVRGNPAWKSRALRTGWVVSWAWVACGAFSALAADLEVSGRLASSLPLPPGASVRLTPWESPWGLAPEPAEAPLPTTLVREDGSFRITAPKAGMWRLLAEGRGLVPLALPLLPLTEPLELAPISWPQASECSIRVRDGEDRPVPGAEARAAPIEEPGAPPSPEPRWEAAPVSGKTDEAGRFQFSCARDQRLRVEIRAPGLAPRQLEVRAGREASAKMNPGRVFRVTVLTPEGRPASQVKAWLEGFSLPLGRTDDAGAMEVRTPPEGRFRLRLLSSEGGLEGELSLPTSSTPPVLKLSLHPVPSLHGRVRAFSDGRAVPGAFLWAGRRAWSWVETDRQGSYTLPLPLDRPRFLFAGASGYFTESLELQVPPSRADEAGPSMALHGASALTGRVEDGDQNPLSAVELRARLVPAGTGSLPLSQRSAGATTRTGGGGQFRFGKLVPGMLYELRLAKAGFAPEVLRVRASAEGEHAEALRLTLGAGLTVRGEILDAEGRPLVGARVTLSPAAARNLGERMGQFRDPDPALWLEAWSDGAGRFVLRHGRAGRHDLRVRAPGFATLSKHGIELAAENREVDLGPLVLEPEGRVEGLVTDASGQPLAGAEIRVLAADELRALAEAGSGGEIPADAVSDASGRFELAGQRAGDRLKLRAIATGFAPAERWGVGVPTEQAVLFRLDRLCVLEGRVVDPQGRPLPGAWVSRDQPQIRVVAGMVASQPRWRQTSSGEDGGFRFEELAPGRVELEARLAAYRNTTRVLALDCKQEQAELELVMDQGSALVGRVLSPGGEPVIGAAIGLHEPTEPGQVSYRAPLATSDGEGRYRLEGLAPEPVRLAASHPAFGEVVARLALVPGELEHDFQFEPGRTVQGDVVDDADQPVPGARVVLQAAGRALGLPAALADAGGRFAFDGLAPGRYSLRVLEAGGARIQRGVEVEVGDADPDPVLLRVVRPGTVVGRLLGLSETDLARTQVFWASELEALGEVAPDGTYRCAEVPAGTVSLNARVAGTGRHANGSVEVEPGGEATLDLDFGAGLSISGRVRIDGVPLARASVTAQAEGAAETRTTTGEDGRFRLEGLSARQWSVAVSDGDGELLWRGDVALERDRALEIDGRASTVEGVVTAGATGEAVAGASVRLLWGSGPWQGQSLRQTSTDTTGAFAFRRVLEGDWWVAVTAIGHAPALEPVVLGSPLQILLPRDE